MATRVNSLNFRGALRLGAGHYIAIICALALTGFFSNARAVDEVPLDASAQGVPQGRCHFDAEKLSFAGTAIEQARCLLRPNKIGGVLGVPARLPDVLEHRIGRIFALDHARLQAYLLANNFHPVLTWSLEWPVARARDDAADAPQAAYFAIHDTSTPYLFGAPFPKRLDQDEIINDLSQYAVADPVAHVFINRRGEIFLGHDYAQAWRATNLESFPPLGPSRLLKGLFLHHELAQPRRMEVGAGPQNDRIAPHPGFSRAQYRCLAEAYAVASARAGHWLIPAFHSAIDEGYAAKHDDPQNFRIQDFAHELSRLVRNAGEAP